MRPDPYILLLLVLLALAMGVPVVVDWRRRRTVRLLRLRLHRKRLLIEQLYETLNTLNMEAQQAIQEAERHFDEFCTATEQPNLTREQWDAAFERYTEAMDLLLNVANGRPTGRKPRPRP